jgi:isoamylase
MPHRTAELRFAHPLPYGAIVHDGGVQFVVFSRSATAMRVLLYDRLDAPDPSEIIDFDPNLNRWGDIWSVFVPAVGPGQLYHVQADGPQEPDRGHRFDPQARLIDPYAKALAGDFLPAGGGIIRPPKCVVISDEFDWQGDRHLRRPLSETIIYEMHVRGFTRSRSSGVKHPGTYYGVIEKIPYLQSLGVTAVELMPVHEFPINDCLGKKPERPNYWGYDPLVFFAPHRGYATGGEPGCQVREFKEMVRELHRAGIEVILDVVFNHTAEGNEKGPVLSLKGLENRVYYMLCGGGRYYRNFSGCGNTLNGNHPIVRELIFHCLRYWVHSFHVDGFRFDLASILSRDQEGNMLPNPPVVESIAEDLRRFWRSDAHMVGPLATRLAGSSDLYQAGGRRPYHSINFITSHDGFTLNDLVSYSEKHNEANGEENRDGDSNNFSCNCGVEGPTRRRTVERVRERQIRNMMASLLLSQGVPMLLFGDECRRTQLGNNNAYCQDNAISWFDWKLVARNHDLRRFCQALVAFRKAEPTIRQTDFLTGRPPRPGGLPDVSWFNAEGSPVDWNADTRSLTCLLAAAPPRELIEPPNHHVLILLHGNGEAREFAIPPLARSLPWSLFIDTAAASPKDVYPGLDGPPPPAEGSLKLESHSLMCYVARDEF